MTYKPYNQGQAYLIPPSGDELIPANHLVRLVSKVIDQMDRGRLLRKYQTRGGASRYHPEMMTKRFVYGYLTKVYSSQMLAKAAWEKVLFMWLSGGQRPDFRTLNDFRGEDAERSAGRAIWDCGESVERERIHQVGKLRY
ncbi:hypothetical protein Holit_03423 [Hollandina sp. SP2]